MNSTTGGSHIGCAVDATPHLLDLRHLRAPEPFERALEAAEVLPPDATLELLTPMMPAPLIDVLARRGFRVSAELLADGSARVHVGHTEPGTDAGNGTARP